MSEKAWKYVLYGLVSAIIAGVIFTLAGVCYFTNNSIDAFDRVGGAYYKASDEVVKVLDENENKSVNEIFKSYCEKCNINYAMVPSDKGFKFINENDKLERASVSYNENTKCFTVKRRNYYGGDCKKQYVAKESDGGFKLDGTNIVVPKEVLTRAISYAVTSDIREEEARKDESYITTAAKLYYEDEHLLDFDGILNALNLKAALNDNRLIVVDSSKKSVCYDFNNNSISLEGLPFFNDSADAKREYLISIDGSKYPVSAEYAKAAINVLNELKYNNVIELLRAAHADGAFTTQMDGKCIFRFIKEHASKYSFLGGTNWSNAQPSRIKFSYKKGVLSVELSSYASKDPLIEASDYSLSADKAIPAGIGRFAHVAISVEDYLNIVQKYDGPNRILANYL